MIAGMHACMHRNHLLLAAFAAVFFPGCDKSESAKRAAPAPTIQVVTDPAAIAAARKAWADSREQTLAAILEDPSTYLTYDDEAVELIRSQQERSVRSLMRTRDDPNQPADRRVRATAALNALGVAPDPAALAALATAEDSALQLLWNLHDFYKPREALPEPIVRVITGAVTAKDERLSSQAASLAGRYRVAGAADAVVERVKTDADAGANFLVAAASLRPTAEVLDVLVTRARRPDDPDVYFAMTAIADLAEATTDSTLRRRAADASAAYLKSRPGDRSAGGNSIDGGMTSAVNTVARAVPPDAAKAMLADVIRASAHRYVVEMALTELQKLDPALAGQVAGERKVAPPLQETPSEERRVTARQAALVCVRHKVLTQAEADAALADLAARPTTAPTPGAVTPSGVTAETRVSLGDAPDEGNTEDLPEGAEGLLYAAKRLITFDTETGTVPNRHDRLILDIAAASAGRFNPEAVLETYTEDEPDADTGHYAVQFVHAGRLYRFEPRDMGDWYDLEAVLAALNRALTEAGAAERFVPLDPNGQFAELVFADPAALSAAAPELGLTLGADPDDARRQGKEYEGQVIEQIRRR